MKYGKPLVEVVWNDAETTHGWEDEGEVDTEQVPIITVGFLIAKSDHIVVIASSIDKGTGQMSNARIKIPLAMIVSVTELSVAHKRTKKQEVKEDGNGPSNSPA